MDEFRQYVLRPGDVVLAMDRPVISNGLKIARIAAADLPALLLQRVGRFQPGPALSSDFLWYLLHGAAFRGQIGAQATGTQLPHVSATDINTAPVVLPPLPEQRRIVAKLDDLLARSRRAKEALDAIPERLEMLRRSILAAAFRGDLTADWRAKHPDVEPAETFLARIRVERRAAWEKAELAKLCAKGKAPTDERWKGKYQEPEAVDASELPELPVGWGWASLDELGAGDSTVCYGVVQPGDDAPSGVRLVRVCDLPDEGLAVDDAKLRTIPADVDAEYERSRLVGGEVLISVVGTIGRVAVATPSLAGANIARAVARITPNPRVPSTWIANWLRSGLMQARLSLESREVARKTLNIGQLVTMPIPLAPAGEMAMVCHTLAERERDAERLREGAEQMRASAKSLDSALLAKAFRGELVP